MTDQVKNNFNLWPESERLRKWKKIGLIGLAASSKAYYLSHLREQVKGPLLVISPHLRMAESLLEDLKFFLKESPSHLLPFPQWETLPYDEISPHPELIRERVRVLFSLMKGENVVIVTSIKALMQKVLSPVDLRESVFSLSVGEEMDRRRLVPFLQENGFVSTQIVEERG